MPLLTRNGCHCGDILKEVKHYPRLDTVLLVEETLKSSKESPTRTALLRKLKGRVMYSTLNVILAYLIDSGKVILDRNKKIVWVNKISLI